MRQPRPQLSKRDTHRTSTMATNAIEKKLDEWPYLLPRPNSQHDCLVPHLARAIQAGSTDAQVVAAHVERRHCWHARGMVQPRSEASAAPS